MWKLPLLPDSLLFFSVSDHCDPVREEGRNPISGRPPDPHKEWAFLCSFSVNLHGLCWHALLPLLVLHAMRDDSEKVPALLTDYILKGKHSGRPIPIRAWEILKQGQSEPDRHVRSDLREKSCFWACVDLLPSLSLACAALSRAALVWERWKLEVCEAH